MTAILFYRPEGVKRFLGLGGNCFVGLVDENTVLKYVRVPNDGVAKASLDAEARIYEAIGTHQRIIKFKGRQDNGILLEYAPGGSLSEYLLQNNPSIQQRVKWVRQVCEAITVIHDKDVIHCDLKANNLLLDASMNVKLCDFQGRLFGLSGKLEQDGGASENSKSFMPRTNMDHADQKTDIFALGSTIYHIMEGHEPYPDLDDFDDELISERFQSGQFPELAFSQMTTVVHKCWGGEYRVVREVVQDVERIKAD